MQLMAQGQAAAILFALFLVSGSALYATDVSQDIRDLQKITNWRASEVNWTGRPDAIPDYVCSVKELDRYATRRIDHEVDSELNDKTATSQIRILDHKVVALLRARGWSKMDVGASQGGIPNLKRCYQKQGAIAQIFQTTGRCTMNSPCVAYDGFAVTFYLPKAKQ